MRQALTPPAVDRCSINDIILIISACTRTQHKHRTGKHTPLKQVTHADDDTLSSNTPANPPAAAPAQQEPPAQFHWSGGGSTLAAARPARCAADAKRSQRAARHGRLPQRVDAAPVSGPVQGVWRVHFIRKVYRCTPHQWNPLQNNTSKSISQPGDAQACGPYHAAAKGSTSFLCDPDAVLTKQGAIAYVSYG